MLPLALTPEGRPDYIAPAAEDVKSAPMPHHRAGLTWTASGYGARIPSTRMVRVGKRWHRVYVAQWSNCGTAYIVRQGKRYPLPDTL